MRKKLDLLEKIKKLSEEKGRGSLLRAVDVESIELKEPPKAPALADFELQIEGAEGAAAVLTRGRTERLEQILSLQGEKTVKWTASLDENAESFAAMIAEGLKEIKTNPPIFGSKYKESSLLASHMDGYTFTLASYDVEFDRLVELFADALGQSVTKIEDIFGKRAEREYLYQERLGDLEGELKRLGRQVAEKEESLKAREKELGVLRSRLRELGAREYESAEKNRLMEAMEAKIRRLAAELSEKAASIAQLNKLVAAKHEEAEKFRKVDVGKVVVAPRVAGLAVEAAREPAPRVDMRLAMLRVEKRTLERLLSSLSDEERGGLRESKYREKLEEINKKLGVG